MKSKSLENKDKHFETSAVKGYCLLKMERFEESEKVYESLVNINDNYQILLSAYEVKINI